MKKIGGQPQNILPLAGPLGGQRHKKASTSEIHNAIAYIRTKIHTYIFSRSVERSRGSVPLLKQLNSGCGFVNLKWFFNDEKKSILIISFSCA